MQACKDIMGYTIVLDIPIIFNGVVLENNIFLERGACHKKYF